MVNEQKWGLKRVLKKIKVSTNIEIRAGEEFFFLAN